LYFVSTELKKMDLSDALQLDPKKNKITLNKGEMQKKSIILMFGLT
jgi:hypothetical protein